jgi:hypothetical protein
MSWKLKVSDTAPPKSGRPAAKEGSILGVILFATLALVLLPNAQSWVVFEFLAHTFGMALLLVNAGIGFLVGFCIGDQIDQLWAHLTGQPHKDDIDSQPEEPDNVVFNIDNHRKRRKVS